MAHAVLEVIDDLDVLDGSRVVEYVEEVDVVVRLSASSKSLKDWDSEVWYIFEVADIVTTSVDGCTDVDICPDRNNDCGSNESHSCEGSIAGAKIVSDLLVR